MLEKRWGDFRPKAPNNNLKNWLWLVTKFCVYDMIGWKGATLVQIIDTERRLDIFCVNENVSFPVGNL